MITAATANNGNTGSATLKAVADGLESSDTTLINLLADIVSKNGNLLLSVPLRADGTFDEKEEKILLEFGAWMAINKECIFGTDPWKIYGEGPLVDKSRNEKGAHLRESVIHDASSAEFRFTQTKKSLYVIISKYPEDKQVLIKSLAVQSDLYPEEISRVELLGYGRVKFTRTEQGLKVILPDASLNAIVPVLRIKK